MFRADSGNYFCCGVREIGDFAEGGLEGETPQELIRSVLNNQRSRTDVPNGIVYHIWFVKRCRTTGFNDDYECDELRQYVQTLPGVIHLGEHVNPNSGNMIDGYFFKDE
jgi:hypothetical protein